ncbi:MAG: universal stress protein [Rhodospirillaceae bacterium]|nr:universal stress protein [Rhodospirillaceae bacterium]
MQKVQTILIPVDGSDHADHGLEIGCALADHYAAAVVLVCVTGHHRISEDLLNAAVAEGVVHPPSYRQFAETFMEGDETLAAQAQNQNRLAERVGHAVAEFVVRQGQTYSQGQHVNRVTTVICNGDPADQIVRQAQQHKADLIVMGTRGLEGLGALLHASVSDAVHKHAPCPCIVCHPARER